MVAEHAAGGTIFIRHSTHSERSERSRGTRTNPMISAHAPFFITHIFPIALLASVLLHDVLAAAFPDRSREFIIAGQLEQRINDAELLWLENKQTSFLTLVTAPVQESATQDTAFLLLHGMGKHPDWPQLLRPLRLQLAASGWFNVSPQLPLLSAQESLSDYAMTVVEASQRVLVILNWVEQQGYTKTVIIGHGFGALTALHALVRVASLRDKVIGLVLLATGEYPYLSPSLKLYQLLQNRHLQELPLLDIYPLPAASDTLSAQALARRTAVRRGDNTRLTQIAVPDADIYFTAQEELLSEYINSWVPGL